MLLLPHLYIVGRDLSTDQNRLQTSQSIWISRYIGQLHTITRVVAFPLLRTAFMLLLLLWLSPSIPPWTDLAPYFLNGSSRAVNLVQQQDIQKYVEDESKNNEKDENAQNTSSDNQGLSKAKLTSVGSGYSAGTGHAKGGVQAVAQLLLGGGGARNFKEIQARSQTTKKDSNSKKISFGQALLAS
jgi:hypothetical protein